MEKKEGGGYFNADRIRTVYLVVVVCTYSTVVVGGRGFEMRWDSSLGTFGPNARFLGTVCAMSLSKRVKLIYSQFILTKAR